ncbi:hypothetical protein Pth03_18130 [Planotetraspora thailandica]|uniref:Uncharacterized protein n=1 Tax=Planotetraspora thailandica TaxID=487172 RepID=A0A8J3UWP0_9ACTN|nr:hypothetical protein Pth03_18130 [Planotetraspora thailandica]
MQPDLRPHRLDGAGPRAHQRHGQPSQHAAPRHVRHPVEGVAELAGKQAVARGREDQPVGLGERPHQPVQRRRNGRRPPRPGRDPVQALPHLEARSRGKLVSGRHQQPVDVGGRAQAGGEPGDPHLWFQGAVPYGLQSTIRAIPWRS